MSYLPGQKSHRKCKLFHYLCLFIAFFGLTEGNLCHNIPAKKLFLATFSSPAPVSRSHVDTGKPFLAGGNGNNGRSHGTLSHRPPPTDLSKSCLSTRTVAGIYAVAGTVPALH